MDFSESTKIVYNRIQKLEPDNVSKIIGYLLLQDQGERDMIRLAFGPDNLIQSLIKKAKTELGLSSSPRPIVPSTIATSQLHPISDLSLQYTPFSPSSGRSFSSPATLGSPNLYWDPHISIDRQTGRSLEFVPGDYQHLENQMQFMELEDQVESTNAIGTDTSRNYYYPEHTLGSRTSRRSPSLPEFPVKVCHYFVKGYCKHGNDCRYFHGHPIPESFSQIFTPNSNDIGSDEHVFSPGSLQKLELEITELLKSRRGVPVSIASLPMMYYDKYRKTLQAEGYLTESQRHGKVGYSLTKLLARLKSICLMDRPHGQHFVILADDAQKYMDHGIERGDPGGIVAGSRQIYLTFPAESTFSEQDVSNYFNKLGPVQDVRIPCQQKRMFGFVTFVFAETVKQILSKGNPHFVCGARVLVKPYREKSRLMDRKYAEKVPQHMCYSPQFIDGDPELHAMQTCEDPRLMRKLLIDEHEEHERRRYMAMQLVPKPLTRHVFIGHSMDELRMIEAQADQSDHQSAEQFSYLFDMLNNGSTSDDKLSHIRTKYNDQDSSLNLPESPFASPIRSGISTAT